MAKIPQTRRSKPLSSSQKAAAVKSRARTRKSSDIIRKAFKPTVKGLSKFFIDVTAKRKARARKTAAEKELERQLKISDKRELRGRLD